MAKQKTVTIRLSEKEWEKIDSDAKERGIDRSKYIRERLLKPEDSNSSVYGNPMRGCMQTLRDIHISLEDMCRKDEETQKRVHEIKRGIEEVWQSLSK